MKIIYLLNHSYRGKWPPPEKLHRVDTLNRRFALRMQEYTDQYEIECWKPERRITERIAAHEDGITYRIFPASRSSFMASKTLSSPAVSMDRIVSESTPAAPRLLRTRFHASRSTSPLHSRSNNA